MIAAPGARPPRVLVSYFFGAGAIPLGASCEAALRALGCETAHVDCRVEHPLQRRVLVPARRLARAVGARAFDPAARLGLDNLSVRERALEAAVDAFRPDLLLVLRGNHYRGELLERLKARHGLATAMWWLYGPEEHHALAADAALYDHAFCIYRTGPADGDIRHLPALAVDPSLYRPEGPRTPHEPEVAFVGRASPRRLAVMRRLADQPIRIWGPGWRKPRDGWNPALWTKVAGRWAEGDTLVRIYRRAKIVLNVSVWNPGQESGLNLRVFDVPACGGFLLTDHSEEIAEWLVPGKEVETWRDVDELRDKLRFYLANDAARERIATAGLARVRTLPTYVDRMRALLEGCGFEAR